jgi:RNA polymerase sigma-70 factor, ECF subfamily
MTEIERQKNDNGRQRILDEVFTEIYHFLFRAAKAILRRKDDACDVIQDLYLKCVERELSCNAMDNPKAYLYRMAVNKALDWKRSRKSLREDGGVEQLEIQDVSTSRANDKVRDALEDLFSKLNFKREILQILVLHHIQGFSDTEIAELLGQTRSKIASILSRAHKKIRNGDLDVEAGGQQHRPDLGTLFAAYLGGGNPVSM